MVRARFKCDSVEGDENAKQVILRAVYSDDPENPNHTFSKYTPYGELRMAITNPSASAYFQVGKTYDIDFKETEV